jgi:hypothetical protein
MAEPCFVCDPSILQGRRCATGEPICERHLRELLGEPEETSEDVAQ